MKVYQLEDIIRATGAVFYGKRETDRFTNVSIDSRKCSGGEVFFAISGERFDGHDFIENAFSSGAAGVVFSDREKVKRLMERESLLCFLEVRDTLEALQMLANFYRRKANPFVVGITGSNGKSTTKEILSSVLEMKGKVLKNPGNFNNLVGLPLSILPVEDECKFAVLEMGMSMAGEIRKLCEIAEPLTGIITNVGLSHSENFSGIEEIGMAKAEMASFIHSRGGTLIYNGDDKVLKKIPQVTDGKTVSFGTGDDCDVKMYDIREETHRSTFKFESGDVRGELKVNMAGIHNAYNCLAAVACALHLGMSPDEIKEGVLKAKSLPGRMDVIELESGVCLIDDTYNANPLSFSKAVDYVAAIVTKGRRIVVMGDMLELGKFSDEAHRKIGKLIAEKGIDVFVTVGAISAAASEEAVKRGMDEKNVYSFGSSKEAGNALSSILSSGDSVLVKGSRGIHLETVVNMVKNRFGETSGNGAE